MNLDFKKEAMLIESLDMRLRLAIGDLELERPLLRAARYVRVYRRQLPMHPFGTTRTLLEKSSRYELVAIRWSAGYEGPICENQDEACWSVVADGQLTVTSYERTAFGGVRRETGSGAETLLERGDFDWHFGARSLYRVSNNGPEPAISLELRASSQTHQLVVDETTGASYASPLYYDGVFDFNALTLTR